MKVFNLTPTEIVYRKKGIPAFGSMDFLDLKEIPDRDLALQASGMLSFGALPKGWKRPVPVLPVPATPAPVLKEVPKIDPKSTELVVEEVREVVLETLPEVSDRKFDTYVSKKNRK